MIGYDPKKREALQKEFSLTDAEYKHLERLGKDAGELTLYQMGYLAKALNVHRDKPQNVVILAVHLAIIKTPERNALPPDPLVWMTYEFYDPSDWDDTHKYQPGQF